VSNADISWTARVAAAARLIPGIALACLLGVAAMWVGQAWPVPPVLAALVMGIGLSFLFDRPALAGGIEVSARDLLRVGVALLGARVTFSEIAAMSWALPVILAATGLCFVLGVGIGRMCGLGASLARISAGAVSICGASAALAISSALPAHKNRDAEAATVVAGVTVIGTIAMIAYPLLAHLLGFDATETGVFLGASLHEVAQAVGAGFAVSDDVGHVATTAKLVRVAALAPMVLLVGWAVTAKARRDPDVVSPPLLPWYLVAFIALAGLASFDLFDPEVAEAASGTSRFMLLTAIAALGLKTKPGKLLKAGPALIVALLLQSLLLLGLVIAGVYALRLIPA
jgi:uncharacterized integral membrane protein (TIGR00698 family)